MMIRNGKPSRAPYSGNQLRSTWSLVNVGDVVFEPLGPQLDDGTTSVREWQQMAVQPDESRAFMTRGTSVRRREDGLVTYAADYFDTASLMDADVQAAARAAGSTITAHDIARHRSD